MSETASTSSKRAEERPLESFFRRLERESTESSKATAKHVGELAQTESQSQVKP